MTRKKFLVEISVRTRHHALVEYRRKNRLSQAALAKLLGISLALVGAWERFQSYPKDPMLMAMLCDRLETTPDELFPLFTRDPKFLRVAKQATFVYEVVPMELARNEICALPSPYEVCTTTELRERINETLHTLTQQEEEVLQKRFFGLDGDEMTYAEIAREKNLSRSRIQQIVVRALRKLRHPSRSKRLKAFVEMK